MTLTKKHLGVLQLIAAFTFLFSPNHKEKETVFPSKLLSKVRVLVNFKSTNFPLLSLLYILCSTISDIIFTSSIAHM